MTKKEYNGWFNYETWLYNLWQDNDEGRQGEMRRLAEEIMGDCGNDRDEASYKLAVLLKGEMEEDTAAMLKESGQTCSLVADLLGAAISEINFEEVAAHWVSEVEVEVEEEAE